MTARLSDQPLLLMDLDRTLFDTDKFAELFVTIVAALAGVPKKKIHLNDFTSGEGVLRYTDYGALIRHYRLSHHKVEAAMDAAAMGKNFLFPDAGEFLHSQHRYAGKVCEVAILTFGTPLYQRMKVTSTPELRGLPVYIVREAKRKHIAGKLSRRFGVLVDDKPGQRLPNGWAEIHLDRAAHLHHPKPENGTIMRVSSLTQVDEALHRLSGGKKKR